MNKGINDSKDLPVEYLSDIYDEIALNEIKLKPTSAPISKSHGSSANLPSRFYRLVLVRDVFYLLFKKAKKVTVTAAMTG